MNLKRNRRRPRHKRNKRRELPGYTTAGALAANWIFRDMLRPRLPADEGSAMKPTTSGCPSGCGRTVYHDPNDKPAPCATCSTAIMETLYDYRRRWKERAA